MKLIKLFEKYMIIILVLITFISLFIPKTFIWLSTDLINYLLIIVMFGMGLTLKIYDFDYILKNPKELGISCISQFVIMPSLAFIIGIF